MTVKKVFALDERLDILKHSIDNLDNVSFDSFSGLLVDYCKEKQLSAIVSGLKSYFRF